MQPQQFTDGVGSHGDDGFQVIINSIHVSIIYSVHHYLFHDHLYTFDEVYYFFIESGSFYKRELNSAPLV